MGTSPRLVCRRVTDKNSALSFSKVIWNLPSIDVLATENKMTRAELKLWPFSRVCRLKLMFKKEGLIPPPPPPHQQAAHRQEAFLFIWQILNIFILPLCSFQERKAVAQDPEFSKAAIFSCYCWWKQCPEDERWAQRQNKIKYICISHTINLFFFFFLVILHYLSLYTALDISGGVACSCLN